MLQNHFVLMVIWSVLTSLFFALIQKREKGPILRLFLILFSCLIGFSVGLAWIMYPFPS